MAEQAYEGWAILEAFGHIRTAGKVREVEQYGAKFCRIDIPKTDGGYYTQDFGGSAIFRLTPTTEESARIVAANNQPAPVHAWELPRLPSGGSSDGDEDDQQESRVDF